ncbi:MAG: QueT transporter family protein [Oscillospiraceae bacterium]|nr:QueT transporter family protein [Oscillospiraceae bacterium]
MNVRKIVLCGTTAALYFALTAALAPISFGAVQFRIAEALCVLPFLFPETVIGLFVGCILANLFSPFGWIDVAFGSAATLLAAVCTAKCRVKWLAPLFPVIVNALIVGGLITVVYEPSVHWETFPINAAYVGAGELGVMYVLGLPLLLVLERLVKQRVKL